MGLDKLNLNLKTSKEKVIVGADISGAKETPNQTWLALGKIKGQILEISQIRKVGIHELAKELVHIEEINFVGLDSPFSLPYLFQKFLATNLELGEFQSWQALAEQIVFMPFEKFQELVISFKHEPKRITDKLSIAQAFSPLHRVNPSMIQMTYQTIKLLAMLDPKKFNVLPFQESFENSCAVLEVYPRAVLKAFGLTDTGYKSKDKKEREKMQSQRHKLLALLTDELEKPIFEPYLKIKFADKVHAQAVDSDHAFDALLACYATALFAVSPKLVSDPFDCGETEILTEGWIYEPRSVVSLTKNSK